MQIFIILFKGNTLAIEAEIDSEILMIKEIIKKKEHVPVDNQRLLYSGKQLRYDKKLNYYKIGPGSTLHLVARLRGD